MTINYEDVILKQLREYMTNRNESIEQQQKILLCINSLFKKKKEEIGKMINDIFDDEQITFSDIPQLINLLCTSLSVISEIEKVKVDNKTLLRYFIYYLVFKYGANEIKYMNPDDMEKFFDSVFNLMINKIAKIKCLC